MKALGQAIKQSSMALGAALPNDTSCPNCGYFNIKDPRVIERWQNELQRDLRAAACQCGQMEYEIKKRLYRAASLPKQMARDGAPMTFNNFHQRTGADDAYRAVYRMCVEREGPQILFLVGATGTGKSHLVTAGGTFYLNKHLASVSYNFGPDLIQALHGAMNPESDAQADAIIAERNLASLLILDDLGQGNGSDFTRDKQIQMINHRYSNGGWLIVTSNDPLEILAKNLGERATSRLSDTALSQVVEMTCSDYRTEPKDSEWKEAV